MSDAGSPDDTDREAATEALMATSRLMTAVVARTLATVPDAVSIPQLRVLVMLHYGAPMNLTAIADGLDVNASNASRTVEKLSRAGLVARDEDEQDRRHRALSLTPRGQQLVSSVMERRRALLDEIVGELPVVEQRRLVRGLSAFLAAADGSGMEPSTGAAHSIIPWIR